MFALVLSLGALSYLGQSQAAFRERTAKLESELAAFADQRFRRPVLRGLPLSGNAAEAIFAALAQLPPLTDADRTRLAEELHLGASLSADTRRLIERHTTPVRSLREGLNCGWSMTYVDLSAGLALGVPDYPRALDAALLLLAGGRNAQPPECLRAATDAVRLGQDLVPGAPLEASALSARITQLAVQVAEHCARHADLDTLGDALGELRTLIEFPPPITDGLRLLDLAVAVETRKALVIPVDSVLPEIIDILRKRDAGMWLMDQLSGGERYRRFDSAYPGLLQDYRREAAAQKQHESPVLPLVNAGAIGFLYDDMRGRVLLRALHVGLATVLAERKQGRAATEPAGLQRQELADPFTGRPLRYRFDEGERALTLWSVGEDLRDGQGTDRWEAAAPLDVVFHQRL